MPGSKWLVNRAARQLPEENREAFTELWTALANIPNSLAKIVFAYRNCTLAVEDIYQEIYRGAFESVAEDFGQFVDHRMVLFEEALDQSKAMMEGTERCASELFSTLNDSLELLQRKQHPNPDAQIAIDQFRDLNPPIVGVLSEHQARLKQRHAVLAALLADLREPVARAAEINLRIKRRLLDDTPLNSDDEELLKSFNQQLNDISGALDTYKQDSLRIDPPKDVGDVDRTLKASLVAFRAAARAVIQV